MSRLWIPTRSAGTRLSLPQISPRGSSSPATSFCWKRETASPPGYAASYEEIASRIGARKAVRAVGSAVARNPVAFLIPCHRVLRKTGAFGEYGFGPARKKAILAWEAATFR